MARIERETAEIEKAAGYKPPADKAQRMRESPAFQGPTAHVVRRYWLGLTRFDLQAEGVDVYLDRNKHPEEWLIRPLSMAEVQAASAMQSAGQWDQAASASWLVACVGLQGPRDEKSVALDKLLRARAGTVQDGAKPTDEALLEAVQQIAYEIPEVVGHAILNLSRDLSEEEKKPSAGPLGESSAAAPAK